MKITIKIQPMILTATSKKEAISKVNAYGVLTFSNYGRYLNGYSERKNDIAIVANYQVQNRKTKQVKNLKTGKTKSIILREKLWTVRVYRIPIELLKIGNLVVLQRHRYFEIVSKKNK
ncbi:MAG: hypothetical protein WC428_01950 [Candidatus Paceibacterota bacterium]